MLGQANTWAKLLKQRRERLFVGRRHEEQLFRLNFVYQIPAYLIFAIHGPAGIGKSALMAQYRTIAEEHNALAPRVDEAQATAIREQTILQTMTGIAQQLADAGTPLTAFEEHYAEYATCMQELANDPNTPAGVFDLLEGIAETEETQTRSWNAYLFDRFGNPKKVALVRTPVETLTQFFVKDLNAWATIRRIVLCFDDWDRVGPHLDAWLREIPAQAELNSNIWVVLAGLDPLSEAWQPYRPVTAELRLERFGDDEMAAYLQAQGITEVDRAADIATFSGGLPILVSVLASAGGGRAGDLALTPIDRYLKWLDEPERRKAVLRCVAARRLDAQVTAAAMGNKGAVELFAWLIKTPLMVKCGDSWVYHRVMREKFLNFAQQQAPESLLAAHTALQAYYENLLEEKAGEARHYREPRWRQDKLEALYHGLMAGDVRAERDGLETFLFVLRDYYPLAGEILLTWDQAAKEQVTTNRVTRWAETLHTGWEALHRQDWEAILAFCDAVAQREDLSEDAMRQAQEIRGLAQARLEEVEAAQKAAAEAEERAAQAAIPAQTSEQAAPKPPREPLPQPTSTAPQDADKEAAPPQAPQVEPPEPAAPPAVEPVQPPAPEAAPEVPSTAQPEPPADLIASALTLAPEESGLDAVGYNTRANVSLGKKAYEEAIQDYGRAIALDPQYAVAYFNRGLAYMQLREFRQAIEDYSQALALNPHYAPAYRNRGLAYARLNDFARAIEDYDQAIALDPEDATAYNNRANAHYHLKDYERAIADYDQAIQRDATYTDAYLNRGLAHAGSEEYQQAIADYNQAIALNPESAIAYNYRGQAYAHLRQDAQALEDYDRALALDPGSAIAHNNRGLSCVRLERYVQAIAAYRKAIELSPRFATAHYNAACAAALMGDVEEACAWLEKAVEFRPGYKAMARRDADFEAVRGDPKFQALLADR